MLLGSCRAVTSLARLQSQPAELGNTSDHTSSHGSIEIFSDNKHILVVFTDISYFFLWGCKGYLVFELEVLGVKFFF